MRVKSTTTGVTSLRPSVETSLKQDPELHAFPRRRGAQAPADAQSRNSLPPPATLPMLYEQQ